MFEWRVEEMRLRNERQHFNKVYDLEYNISREDKIAFVDQMQDGKMSCLLNLIGKYNQDASSLPKDKNGIVKTVSLKAWIRRNDKKNVVDIDYNTGSIRLLQCRRRIQHPNGLNSYDVHDDLVDELFHRQLIECRIMEDSYFKKHDEYEILKEKFRNREYGTTFGVNISECSNGRILVYKENEDASTAIWNNKDVRDITVEELKELLDKYDQLDKLVEKLTSETHIVY